MPLWTRRRPRTQKLPPAGSQARRTLLHTRGSRLGIALTVPVAIAAVVLAAGIGSTASAGVGTSQAAPTDQPYQPPQGPATQIDPGDIVTQGPATGGTNGGTGGPTGGPTG